MTKVAMAVTMVILAAAPLTAQQADHPERAEHPHSCPHLQGAHPGAHEGAHEGGNHAMGHHPMRADRMGGHEMGEHHAAMQDMHEIMMMVHHPEMLDLSEAQVQRLTSLMERIHAEGMPHVQGPEAMSGLVDEARGILTAEQRERLAEMDHPMGDACPMMRHGEQGHH